MFTMSNWDQYFLELCVVLAKNSKCLSRKVGAIIVRDKSIVSTGYNGPPRGTRHCEGYIFADEACTVPISKPMCPRRVAGYESGQGLELCPAAHAETNAIANAARLGVNCNYTTLYLNCIVPCKNCAASIINAGIKEVICLELTAYDELGLRLLDEAGIKIRTFNLVSSKI
jgi:dCMP deaminase